MLAPESGPERLYRWLLRVYPSDFRARFGDEMVQLFADQLRDARGPSVRSGTVRTWIRTLSDLAVTAASEHARKDRTVAQSLATPPSTIAKLLGAIGILGGVMLVAAFVPSIEWSPDFVSLRLALFNVGAIAIVIAVHRRQSFAAPGLALAAAIPAVVANALYLAIVVGLVAPPGEIGSGSFGLTFAVAGPFLWLADAWFGLVITRLGVVSRGTGLALVLSSVLALSGVDRLGLVSGEFGAILGPLALLGIAVNGLCWIALGIEVAFRRRAIRPA